MMTYEQRWQEGWRKKVSVAATKGLLRAEAALPSMNGEAVRNVGEPQPLYGLEAARRALHAVLTSEVATRTAHAVAEASREQAKRLVEECLRRHLRVVSKRGADTGDAYEGERPAAQPMEGE